MSVTPAARPGAEPFLRFLAAPDEIDVHTAISPIAPAAALAVAVAGSGLFAATVAAALGGGETVASGEAVGKLPALLLCAPLAQLLCYPPLLLTALLRDRPLDLLRIGALAVAGPGAAGAVLGASVPVLALFALTGVSERGEFPQVAIGLVAAAVAFGAAVLGARNTVRASRSAGASSPGLGVMLAHYAVATWTTAILLYHLS